jgi:hypothetical protein
MQHSINIGRSRLTLFAESARPALQAIVDKSLGAGITRVVVSPIANKRVQLVVGAHFGNRCSHIVCCSLPYLVPYGWSAANSHEVCNLWHNSSP